MQADRPGKKEQIMTVENKVAPSKQMFMILIVPLLLVFCFWAIFIIENQGLPPNSDYLNVIAGCIYKMVSQGNTGCLPDLGYILICTIIGGPFAFWCSYKIWQNQKSKIILTDQKIIKKKPFGKEIQLYWSEIKKIKIISGDAGTQLFFTRNKGLGLFDNKNRIFCPPSLKQERPFLPPDAVNLILSKIDLYNIPIKGEKALLWS